MKYIPALGQPDEWCHKVDRAQFAENVGDYRRFCPYGQPGNRLWVREKLSRAPVVNYITHHAAPWRYDADGTSITLRRGDPESDMFAWAYHKKTPWCHPMHMPRWASRLTLEIVSVRVERLQDISEEDAEDEGFESEPCSYADVGAASIPVPDGVPARDNFGSAWDSINGKRAPWESNPWVYVVEFTRAAHDASGDEP